MFVPEYRRPQIISVSDIEPITLDEAVENLRVVDPQNNSPEIYPESDRILKLITAARQTVEEELDMSLVPTTIQVTQSSLYPTIIALPRGPVRDIISVTYVDTEGYDTVLATDQYRLSTAGHIAMLRPAYGVTWPTDVRTDDESVRVVYSAGYSTDSPPEAVPQAILQAMHLLIGHWFANREAVVVGTITAEVPLSVRYILSKYRTGLGV